jgi:hypothetical protein
MNATRITGAPATPEERAHLTFWTLGAAARDGRDGVEPNEEMLPGIVPLSERFSRLPEALLLTAGYYASRTPVLRDLLRRTS